MVCNPQSPALQSGKPLSFMRMGLAPPNPDDITSEYIASFSHQVNGRLPILLKQALKQHCSILPCADVLSFLVIIEQKSIQIQDILRRHIFGKTKDGCSQIFAAQFKGYPALTHSIGEGSFAGLCQKNSSARRKSSSSQRRTST